MTQDEALARVVRIQKVNRLLGALLVPAAGWLILNALWPVAGFLWWVLFVALCVVGIHIFNIISLAITVFSVTITSGGIEEEPDEKISVEAFEISNHPESPIARYMDADIFEWIDFADSKGVVRRADFLGTLDLSKEVYIPPNTLLMPPGILYEWQDKGEQAA